MLLKTWLRDLGHPLPATAATVGSPTGDGSRDPQPQVALADAGKVAPITPSG
jgi:hypothetical protein